MTCLPLNPANLPPYPPKPVWKVKTLSIRAIGTINDTDATGLFLAFPVAAMGV